MSYPPQIAGHQRTIPQILGLMGLKMFEIGKYMWYSLLGILFLVVGILLTVFTGFYPLLVIVIIYFLAFGIMILIRNIQYLRELKNLQMLTNDPELDNAYTYLMISLIINFFGMGIISLILEIMAYGIMERWANRIYQSNPNKNTEDIKEGIASIKLGTILSIVFIGIFIIPKGFTRTGEGLIREYAPYLLPKIDSAYTHSAPIPPDQQPRQMQQYGNQSLVQEQQYVNRPLNLEHPPHPEQPTIQNKTQEPNFCPQCGSNIPSPSVKFCGICGHQFN
jgi:hypothetical protein